MPSKCQIMLNNMKSKRIKELSTTTCPISYYLPFSFASGVEYYVMSYNQMKLLGVETWFNTFVLIWLSCVLRLYFLCTY